jgi:multicomponent Na+:H+ antiporter subunit E
VDPVLIICEPAHREIRTEAAVSAPEVSPPGLSAGAEMKRHPLHLLIVWLGLFAFWVVLSGKLDALHLAMGAGSAALVTWLSADELFTRMDAGERRWLTFIHWGRFLAYLPWLGWEIVKANIQVLKLVLGPLSRLRPSIVTYRAPDLSSEVSRVFLANSITLTPGTVTLDLDLEGVYTVPRASPSSSSLVARN